MPKRHPVGMTAIGHTEKFEILSASPADWISPGEGEREAYKFDPPAADGKKVILLDMDHLWGLGGTYQWAWKQTNCFRDGHFHAPFFAVHRKKKKGI